MHMISKKDLNSAEMDTLTKSCSPTIVITANGEVQTHEEATVYVKELGGQNRRRRRLWQWHIDRLGCAISLSTHLKSWKFIMLLPMVSV